MAEICEYGTAPIQLKEGYRGIMLVAGTDREMLEQFQEDDIRLVRGAMLNGSSDRYEFFVMEKDARRKKHE